MIMIKCLLGILILIMSERQSMTSNWHSILMALSIFMMEMIKGYINLNWTDIFYNTTSSSHYL